MNAGGSAGVAFTVSPKLKEFFEQDLEASMKADDVENPVSDIKVWKRHVVDV